MYTFPTNACLALTIRRQLSQMTAVFSRVWESREYDHCKPNGRVSEAAEVKAMIDYIESSIL